jgi:uncharacterized caspase-like protein
MKLQSVRHWFTLALAILCGCATTAPAQLDIFEIVDCEIPGAVLRIGAGFSTTGRSQALRTSGSDCAIRGGYFVVANAANYVTSLKVWQPLADAGDEKAQYYLGRIYDNGLGRAPDPTLAAVWYKKAADKGNTAALTALAGLYEKGGIDGGPNPSKALDLYRQAAKLTEPLAFARDVRERDATIEALKRELEATKRGAELQSEEIKQKVAQRDQEVQRTRVEVQRVRAVPKPVEQQVSKAEQAARDAESELRRETQRLSNAESEAARARAALNAIDQQATGDAIANGPRIELVQPSMTPMRGLMTVRVAANVREVTVVTKISSRTPVARAVINEENIALDSTGNARTTVAIKGGTTPVQIVATDAQGRKALLAFVIASEAILADAGVAPSKEFGNYHAVVIGNSRYKEWDSLNSPRHDSNAIANLLRTRYGFQVKLLQDATRQDIIRELSKLRTTLTPKDNLLVYYAGHGFWDSASQRGYWVPVDAAKSNPANWISSADITDQLSVIPAKQVLVVADSCYSGVLVGSISAQLDKQEGGKSEWLAKRAQMRSRKVMSSGNIAQVMDGGAGNNSIFARQFINALTKRGEPFEAHELYREVAPQVEQAARGSGAKQEPQYGPMRHAGHEAGDFIFVPKS